MVLVNLLGLAYGSEGDQLNRYALRKSVVIQILKQLSNEPVVVGDGQELGSGMAG
jgi:hypothetical protein